MLALILAVVLGQVATPERPQPFAIRVVDDQTGRGVPLVELTTVNNITYITDSAGVVAFDEPGLLGREVHFKIQSFGYSFPKDGFGIAGKTVKTSPGGSVELKIHRDNVAERLYRTTGGGIYRDSTLVGRPAPIREPLLNAQVLGQDTIQSVLFGGEILWFWGDTNKPSYPLGNFDMPMASSPLPSQGGLDPEVGVNFTYETDKTGFARGSAMMPGDGPTWLNGFTVLRDDQGNEHLFAVYDKIRNMLETYQRGLVEWDAPSRQFRKINEFPLSEPLFPLGHSFLHDVDGVSYVYFAAPLPLSRVRADVAAFRDLSQYEAWTPYKKGTSAQAREIDRDENGRVVYAWKKNTPPAEPAELANLVKLGLLDESECAYVIRGFETGKTVVPHRGSVHWNAYRNRWVMVFVEIGGKSMLGEVYFAEADSPLGPWVYARKIATHAQNDEVYSFYNPKHHAFLDKDSGRTIFFEGTYTALFSGNKHPTPRYDYNQILYKLDLTRPELVLPVPIYEDEQGRLLGPADVRHGERAGHPVAFLALDRKVPGAVALKLDGDQRRLIVPQGDDAPLFYGLPLDSADAPQTSALREFRNEQGQFRYLLDGQSPQQGFEPTGTAPCRVWRNPSRVVIPSH